MDPVHRLADADLLALVLGTGRSRWARDAAQRLLDGRGLGKLAEADKTPWWDELSPAQHVRLGAVLELARRLDSREPSLHPYVRGPRDVFEATADLRSLRREHFVGLYLNTRNRLLARETVSMGSLNASIVHPREVFEPAVRQGAASIVVVHNHPSGETDPSEDDLAITRRLSEAGEILGILLLDHVIVGIHGFTSLKESSYL